MPWHQALDDHSLRLDLLDSDGQPVLGPSPHGMTPIVIEAEMKSEASELPTDIKPGTPIDVVLAFTLPPLPLPPGGRFEWRLSIDGKTREDWFLAFSTRPARAAQAA